MTETIRAFIAIELSDEARAAVAKLQNRLKTLVPAQTVRWTAPENIHLTLHFLGNIEASQVDSVKQLLPLSGSACPAFSLSLSGLGCFPNTRRPRIVWTGVLGQTEALVKLYHDLGKRLLAIGYTPEARPYAPHLTIGRVREGLPAQQLTRLGQILEREQNKVDELAELRVVEIALMQSDLKPGGPVYIQLAHASLTAAVRG
jgi:2'-5' RNA ligase